MSEVIHIKFDAYKPPVIKDVKPDNIFLYGADANKPYPDTIISYYERSTKHKAMIDTKVRLITGTGWKVDNNKVTSAAKEAELRAILKKANPNETYDEVWQKVALDDENFDAIALEIIYNAKGEPAEVYHVPVARIRAYLTETGKLKYIYLKDWKGQTKYSYIKENKEKNGFKEWWPYKSKEESKPKSELLYLVGYRPVKSGETAVYGLPRFSSAIPWIECDIRTANFHYNLLKKNFSADGILNFNNGAPSTPEGKKKIEDDFKKKFQGDDAKESGGVTIVFNKDKANAVTFTRLEAGDLDKKFLTLEDYINKNLRIAHNGFPEILLGETKDGVFVTSNEEQALISYKKRYVTERQVYYERIMNWIHNTDAFKLSDVVSAQGTTNPVVEALNGLTPLIAGKVLEMMSKEQILGLIGLKEAVRLKSDEFELIGETADPDSEIIYEFGFKGDNPHTDSQYKGFAFAKILDIEINTLQADVMSLIDSNKKITVPELSQALKVGETDIQEALDELIKKKAITGEIGNLRVTKGGRNTIDDQDYELETVVRYVYELAPDAPPLKAGGKSRPWCVEMTTKTAMGIEYSREQIEKMRNDQNTSAWLYRGGWYNNNGDPEPFCRHRWKAVVRTKRKKRG